MYYGDIRLSQTIEWTFTTRNFSTGAPFTLAGTPSLEAYETGNTTPITAGITLTVDYSGVTGLNYVSIVASGANGFATANDISVVIAAGTVNSVSVVGETIGAFSIENRSALMPTTAGRTLNVSAGGVADADTVAISTDATAADRLETMLDGTGGNTLSLGKLAVVAAVGVDAVVLTAGAASGATPAGAAVRATGGAASTTGGGVSGPAVVAVGGAGAATTNGAAPALTLTGGGTDTVSGAAGAVLTGTGLITALTVQGGTDAAGAEFWGGAPNGDGVWFRGVGTGDGSGVGIFADGHHGIVGRGNDDTGRGAYFLGSVTGAGGIGMLCAGGLDKPGIMGLGGDTGAGMLGQGGDTSGAGIEGFSPVTDAGIHAVGSGAGAGMLIEGGATGRGLDVRGGATSGEAALFFAQGGDSDAVLITGDGAGSGVSISGGTDGRGLNILGGATAGEAVHIESLAALHHGLSVIEGAGGKSISASVETGADLVDSLRLANTANGAKLSGAATTTVVIRDLADTKDRVTATVDASGNRTAVTRDLT